MRERFEEEPEEPEEPDEPGETPSTAATISTLVPAVPEAAREFEYRTELVTAKQLLDGTTLADQLTRASGDGWDLVDVIAAGDRHAILLRRAKRAGRESRPVGFAPPRP